jgi:hypothetical protein
VLHAALLISFAWVRSPPNSQATATVTS